MPILWGSYEGAGTRVRVVLSNGPKRSARGTPGLPVIRGPGDRDPPEAIASQKKIKQLSHPR